MKFMDAHEDSINDAKFSPLNKNWIVTASSDGFFKLWDLRDRGYKSTLKCSASKDQLNCATFNNVNQHLLLTAGEESGSISIWDLRMPESSINTVSFHKAQVTSVEWHPTAEQIFVSGSDDGKVYVWDNSKNGEEQSRRDYEDGPPELVFPHDWHSSNIEDVCWCPRDQPGLFPMLASLETERVVQIWKPKEDFFEDEIEHLASVAKIAEEDLE